MILFGEPQRSFVHTVFGLQALLLGTLLLGAILPIPFGSFPTLILNAVIIFRFSKSELFRILAVLGACLCLNSIIPIPFQAIQHLWVLNICFLVSVRLVRQSSELAAMTWILFLVVVIQGMTLSFFDLLCVYMIVCYWCYAAHQMVPIYFRQNHLHHVLRTLVFADAVEFCLRRARAGLLRLLLETQQQDDSSSKDPRGFQGSDQGSLQ